MVSRSIISTRRKFIIFKLDIYFNVVGKKRIVAVIIAVIVISALSVFVIHVENHNFVKKTPKANSSITFIEEGLPKNMSWEVNISTSGGPYAYNDTVAYHDIITTNNDSITFTGLTPENTYVITIKGSRGYYPGNMSTSFGQLYPGILGVFSFCAYISPNSSSVDKPVNNTVELHFSPSISVPTVNYEVQINGTMYRIFVDYAWGEDGPSEYTLNIWPGLTAIAPIVNGSYNSSSGIFLGNAFTVNSINFTSNATGFSLRSVTPELPIELNRNNSQYITFTMHLNLPSVPTIATVTFILTITGWKPS